MERPYRGRIRRTCGRLSVLILIGNFGVGGFIGNTVSHISLGAFGLMAYLFPFALFLGVAFAVVNKEKSIMWVKLGGCCLMWLAMSIFCELINGYDKSRNLMDYYKYSIEEHTGGGIIGGIFCKVFCPSVGIAAEEEVKNTATATITPQTAQTEEDYIFNERDINYYWQEYAGRMPKEQVAIAKRMQNMHVTLLNATTFEAVVDNEIVAKEFISMTPQLQEYLRTRLKNRKVTMSVRISTPTEKVRAYGRVEKFQMMVQKNNALLQLKDEFGLELY